MKIKSFLFKDKVLVLAILFSAVWHIFWLSAFKVVVVPKEERSIKFSNVSFLGPILERSVLSMDVRAHERTAREKSYFATAETHPVLAGEEAANDSYILPGIDIEPDANGEEFRALSVSRIDTAKIEPGRDI